MIELMRILNINAMDIPDAWFQLVYNILDHGRKYIVEQGSFVGQTRLEFDWVTVKISFPYSDPYDTMLPQIPEHLNIPNPVESGYVEQYVPYLMTNSRKSGEDYTYGERLCAFANGMLRYFDDDQISQWIRILKRTPNTNQAILQVAEPADCLLEDPPCLRHIDVRVRENYLIFYPYFRSWDLWGGFPANLAGIAVLQKYMADEIGVNVGPMIAASKGLHIYGYVEEMARIRANKM